MGSLIAELIGFFVIIFVIWRYVVPPVRKIMTREQDKIRKQVQDSEAAHQRLEEAETKYRSAIEEARTEADKIRDGARADAQRIVDEMRQQADRQVERIRQRGEEQLENERRQIIRELHAHVAELSTSLAGELVSERLSDSSRRGATVDRFLDELESMAASSGSNGEQPAARSSVANKGNKGEA